MRGLNSGGGNSPTVGFYVDEIPVTSFAFATAGKVVIDPDLYDLSRVEILARSTRNVVRLRIHGRHDSPHHQPA